MKKIRHRGKAWLLSAAILLMATAHSAPSVYAETTVRNGWNYVAFFSEAKNFFLFHPNSIREIFYSISILQGNPRVAKRHIERDIFSCRVGAALYANCPVDRLETEKRELKIPNSFEIAVNFSKIENKKYNKNMRVVALSWKPDLPISPVMSIREFLAILNIAKESKYFRIIEPLKQIRFHVVLDRDFQIIMDAALADNLISSQNNCSPQRDIHQRECVETTDGVYRTLPTDFQDRLLFVLNSTDFTVQDEVGSHSLYFQATRARINQQYFKVRNDKVW